MHKRIDGPGVLPVDLWVAERRDQCLRIGNHRSGDERSRWFEEAGYYQTILDLIQQPAAPLGHCRLPPIDDDNCASFVERLPAPAGLSDAELLVDMGRLLASAPHGEGLTQRLSDIIAEYSRRQSIQQANHGA